MGQLKNALTRYSSKVLLKLFLVSTFSTAVQAVELDFEHLNYPNKQRQSYPILLLDLALRASGKTYVLTPSANDYEQKRALTDLASNKFLDVSWSMTSIDRESMLLPIRIPIFKGLIGWRIPLVHSNSGDLFLNSRSKKDIRTLKAGQMHDWPDTRILEWNGMTMFRSSSYAGLFKMLAMERIDYFPRSVIEVWREYEANKSMQIKVDENILIYYPTAFYYFVNKNRPDLARAIESGLETMINDGRFDELFMRYHEEYIEAAKLDKRKLIVLKNTLLPPRTPINRPELWYKPTIDPISANTSFSQD